MNILEKLIAERQIVEDKITELQIKERQINQSMSEENALDWIKFRLERYCAEKIHNPRRQYSDITKNIVEKGFTNSFMVLRVESWGKDRLRVIVRGFGEDAVFVFPLSDEDFELEITRLREEYKQYKLHQQEEARRKKVQENQREYEQYLKLKSKFEKEEI